MKIGIDYKNGVLNSLRIGGRERLSGPSPLFTVCVRDENGGERVIDSRSGEYCAAEELDTARRPDAEPRGGYSRAGYRFGDGLVSVIISCSQGTDSAEWGIEVVPAPDAAVEWVEWANVILPPLKAQDPENGGTVLWPYNEGVLVDDAAKRDQTAFRSVSPAYPSHGCMPVFPNMICSQFIACLWYGSGFYLGAHDPGRGVKAVDFFSVDGVSGAGGAGGGTALRMRVFGGRGFGETFSPEWKIVWRETDGAWESCAGIYRSWFESELPPGVVKIADNDALPDWYGDMPLIVSYPVRGRFDTDEMTPNRFFPYTKALPELRRIGKATGSRIMALLMHWEGTAPWAPPRVWPPFGGTGGFNAFRDRLHESGDLLGVYCSGFGYTMKSRLTDYSGAEEYASRGLESAMCAGPDGKVAASRICTAQRDGYDICAASPAGTMLLNEAYGPLLGSGIDYSQILDQNHGGGQYFCYSRAHGHPPVPGEWMTSDMQRLLSGWNEKAPGMLLGCESAAAEPFAGYLRFSDNRFELNFHFGRAVPVYAFIYHEYLHNFMGNQVSNPFSADEETFTYRLAYSFCAGDCMTVVLSPDGGLLNAWGERPGARQPDERTVFELIRNLTAYYRREGRIYLERGRMTRPAAVECGTVSFGIPLGQCELPSVLVSAWEAGDGRTAHVIVNPFPFPQTVAVGGGSEGADGAADDGNPEKPACAADNGVETGREPVTVTVPALDAVTVLY